MFLSDLHGWSFLEVNIFVMNVLGPLIWVTMVITLPCCARRRAWKSADEAKDVPTRTLYLVRHGKYDFKTGHLDNLGELAFLLHIDIRITIPPEFVYTSWIFLNVYELVH